jgi:hypothetical protein
MPCPTAILTIGVLLAVRGGPPLSIAVIPAAWAFIGGSAALLFGVWTDYMLLAAGVSLTGYLVMSRVIRPMGAFVPWQLPRAVRRRAERHAADPLDSRRLWRSVRATADERARALPGDERISQAVDTLTHAVTIRRPARDVWPWLVQMGAGSRGGWYSYDWLDNGRKPSASRIVPELQHPAIGTIFPALPGMAEGFTLLAMEHERMLMLGWPAPDGTPVVTWTFLLDELAPGVTRLLVRVRGGPGYRFHALPLPLTRLVIRVVHFIMQRKQLLGVARRAEATVAGPADAMRPWPAQMGRGGP